MKLTTVQMVVIATTVILLAALLVLVLVLGHDPTVIIAALVTVVPLVGVMFGVDVVRKQTNGTLSELRAEVARKDALITALAASSTPTQVKTAHSVAENTITRETLNTIRSGLEETSSA